MAATKRPRDIDTLYKKAKACEESGDFKKAEKFYRDALSLEDNPGAWGMLGWTLLQKNLQGGKPDFQEALAAAKKMRTLALKYKSRPLLAVADCLVGNIHHHAGRAAQAEQYYRESLEAGPRPETCIFLGKLLEEFEKYGESKKCYQRAIQIDPQNKDAHYNLALRYKAEEEYENAVMHLSYVLEADEHDTAAIFELAVTLWHLGTGGIKEARVLLNKLLRHDPRNIESRLLLALTYKLLKKLKDAEILFRLTIEQLPPDSRANWCFAYFLANDLKDAVEADFYFRKAIQLDPQSGAAYYYYGQFLINEGREEKGMENLEKAVGLGFEKATSALQDLGAPG